MIYDIFWYKIQDPGVCICLKNLRCFFEEKNTKNLSLTFTGIIDAADYESDVILSDLKYRLEKHALFKRVEITSKKPGHENTLTFQMSIAL